VEDRIVTASGRDRDDAAPQRGPGGGPEPGPVDPTRDVPVGPTRDIPVDPTRDVPVDPLDEAPPTSPRGSLALTVVAFVLGALAFLPTGLSFLVGPVGMACGLIAHLKGRRAGFGAAVVAAVGTVVGLSLRTFLDIY
jgi:hypothetical protein